MDISDDRLPYRYWVSYTYELTNGKTGWGATAIYRDIPLYDTFEVMKLAKYIQTEVMPESGTPAPEVLIIIGWQPFEAK